jgi:outer membrane protein OmpA-like peptidoglycan-associated protein
MQEIGKLLSANTQLKVHVVGHTDNQGRSDYNVDLSRRRAANVVRELTSKYGIAADRLDSFGCGMYAPVASNDADEGRAKNRRVELVKW